MKNIIAKLIKPTALDDNIARKEYILNLMLLASIITISLAFLYNFLKLMIGNKLSYQHQSLCLILISCALGIFIFLLYFIKKGYSRLFSYILLWSLFILAVKMGLRWGADLPAEILFYVLAIVASGILVSSRLCFIFAFLSVISFSLISYLQTSQILKIDRSWINDLWGYSDVIISSLILLIIATISWLSDHETQKALHRAYQSEKELKIERDNLEIRIIEKTRELKMVQAAEVERFHRFAEFGRQSSGLFHDLVNPLTTMKLNIEKIQSDQQHNNNYNDIDYDLNQISQASKKMEEFIGAVRKQIKPQGRSELFCLNQEIEEAITFLAYKSKKEKVIISFSADEKIMLNSDPIKFSQVVTNLISNAIDAYAMSFQPQKEIIIDLTQKSNNIILSVTDNGEGIDSKHINQIFDPFFSTKLEKDNLGLGLSLIKNLIEKDFKGEIKADSILGEGSCFTVRLPI